VASITFIVPGKPQPKERPRLGRGGFVYTPGKTQVYEALVARKAKEAMLKAGLEPFDGPVSADITMVFAVPKSWPKQKRQDALNGLVECVGRADADNIFKGGIDALQGRKVKKVFVPGAVIFNDSHVTHGSFSKIYGPEACIKITIRELSRWQRTTKSNNGPQTPWSVGLLTPSYHTQSWMRFGA
jgi:Holliday junction resolvase RusA-like endonuclease